MDSVLEEDVTLPGTLSGCSGLVPKLPDDLHGVSPGAGLGNGVLPNVSEETVSPTRARNMKDFENQITELKKENFNLKLRIYFLEERMQQEFDGPTEHIYKTNIELKVEVESLKQEIHERERLLIQASKAVESLAEGRSSEVRRMKEDAQRKVQQVEDLLTKKVLLLQEDVKAAQAELEKAFAGAEREKALRLSLEKQLSEMRTMHEGNADTARALEDRDRLIEELCRETVILRLKGQKSQVVSVDESVSSGELQGLPAAVREEKERTTEAAQMECQEERNRFEERIQALQEDLREKEREIAVEKKNSLKRDKAIQGLTMALKSKEKEVEELNSEIEELNAACAKAREACQKAQTQKVQESENYEAALLEKAAVLAELHSENLTKSTENHSLCRNMEKVTQELSDLQQEKERLEKDLEAARREHSRGERTIHDLRNEVEKLRNEVNEREKAVENGYKSQLSESNQELDSQGQMLRHLTGSTSHVDEDLLLQKFNEKDLEAIQQNRYLMTAEDFKFRSEDLITEKWSSQQSPGSKSISEEKQQLDYEELIQVLKKERDVYSHLVKSLQDSDSAGSLQAELDSIHALRKQLEQEVFSYRNLQKMLEERVSEVRRREAEEPFSFYSDQTSYLSICLEEHSRFQVEQFSQEELKRKVADLIQLVKELYTDNQHLKKAMFDLSCVDFQRGNELESKKQTELPASKEVEDTIKIGEDDENNVPSDQHLEQSDKIVEDCSKGGCKNGYLRHTDSSLLDSDGAHTPGCPGDPSLEEGDLLNLLAPSFSEKATLLLESRPDLLKVLRELLLEPVCLTEEGVSGEHLDGKTEKTLEQMAVQLRGELRHFIQANSFSKPRNELKSPGGAQPVKAGGLSKLELKDASVQTMITEGDMFKVKHEGEREAWEEQPTDATLSTEHQPESWSQMPGRLATPSPFPGGADKDAKKSRLPILMKPSRPLESVCQLPATQELVVQLQDQILELQGELKEFKTRNKQLHQKLILADAMMEGRPAPDKTLLKDSGLFQPSDLAIVPTCNVSPSEDFQGPVSAATYLSSEGQLSTNGSVIGTNQSENIDTSNDTENLKQKICDLEAELEGYRNLFQLQKHSQCSEAIITISCGTEGTQDTSDKPMGNTDEEEMTFSSLHQVRFVKHMKILHPLAPEMIDGRMLESLEQQLVKQDCELQKEQHLNMELFSEAHNMQNKLRDLSPSRYNSLVQSQARELSLQRQQIKESHGACVVCRQHMNTVMKAFGELLRASDVDYYVAEGFREQLKQCAELLEKLEKLFLSGKSAGEEMSPQNQLLERTEEDSLSYQHILPESPEPAASHAVSDCEMSEKSSSFYRDQKQDSETEKTSVMANNFSQDLLMEHIQEIRSLRKRLEESIKTNEKLRRQLEQRGSEGSANIFAYGSELHNSLMSEIRFLRKQNQALNTMLARGSRDKQKENEKLRESLSRKTANLEHLQQELACVKGENERLQKESSNKDRQNQQLLQELCGSRCKLSRVQEEVQRRQQLLAQNNRLLQSLYMELKVFEKLDAHRVLRESRAEATGEGCQGQDPVSDLHGLLTEVQALRAQLERSSDTHSTLQGRLEEQLANGEKKAQEAALTMALQILPVPERPLQLHHHDGERCPVAIDNAYDLFDSTLAVTPRSASQSPPLSANDVDTLSCISVSSATSTPCTSLLVPGHHLWASKSGCHILGLIEDYDALCKQIGQGQKLLAEMDTQIQEAPSSTSQELGTKTGEMKAEITKLQKKLFEQEKNFQNTVKLLQLSKHQEKVIFDQLVVTHKILRKARGNLELRPLGTHPGTSSPSRPGS